MFASIRRYETAPEDVSVIIQRARDGFVPLITQTKGFRAYYFIETGKGQFATISIFDAQEQAESSVTLARNWVAENMDDIAVPPPQADAGEVVIHLER
jgi:hypothetical protein